MKQSSQSDKNERRPNKLISDKSPYLLQHAYNPVDWYPWGEEAFQKAKKEHKPVFLSIGYSTCHWCHVMAEESFDDPDVARLMNDAFVSIKVDREERPDIDSLYMTICQMMTGSGGWPLNIIMTPDKKPFFAATYIPKETRYGRTGMLELIPQIKEIWTKHYNEVADSVKQITEALQQVTVDVSGEDLKESALKIAYVQLSQNFDERYGGFGTAQKFPTSHNFFFLLRYGKRSNNNRALEMVEKTLQSMQRGGIYDHIGFGFHRYAVEQTWLIPHFEKMLYDQALLAMAYIEAYQATKKEEYAQTAKEIFTYVLRDMTGPDGGFYSGEDADSEGEEGKFYLWTEEEMQKALGKKDAEFALQVFNVKREGNFIDEAAGRTTGKNILHFRKSVPELAVDLNMTEEKFIKRLEKVRQKLFAVREKRIRPHKDDKILTDWNGLMIAALAKGAQVFDEPLYAESAKKAVDFILTHMMKEDGRLLHRFRDDEAKVPAQINDYAFLIWGLIELYEATFEVRYLQKAIDLNSDLIKHFWDEKGGGFYFTADDAEELLTRWKEVYDGAIPSGNSVAMLNLLRLGRMTANTELENKSAQLIKAFSQKVTQAPMAYTHFMGALDFITGPSNEVVIVGNSQAEDTKELIKALRETFSPNKVVLFCPSEVDLPEITRIAEYTSYLFSHEEKATAYVCRNYTCKVPTTNKEKMLMLLNTKGE